MSERGEPDFAAILAVLDRHRVDYVLLGGLAAAIYGSGRATEDVDIAPLRQPRNLTRLAAALEELRAKEKGGRKRARIDDQWLRLQETWHLETRYGDLDIVTNPAGVAGYPSLARNANTLEFEGMQILVASLEDLIQTKEASGRAKDRAALPELRRLLGGGSGEVR